MNFDEEPSQDPTPARGLIVVVALLVAAALAAGVWLLARRPATAPAASARTAVRAPAPSEAPAASTPAPPPSTAPAPVRRAARKAKPEAPPPAATPATMLKVDSDVPGASVFVDRVFVGKTPLATGDVAAGSHVVHVAAEGYESQSNTVDLAGGPTDLMVRFKVVRLDEAIPVIHKHTIGSCEGRLVADARGFRYETSNRDHAFALPFPEVRAFEVDYLKKNLKLTRKDGKTFNYTDRSANADALFVFHEKVEKARAKLAAGWPPADR